MGLIKDFVRTERRAVLVLVPGKHQHSSSQAEQSRAEHCFPRQLVGVANSAEPWQATAAPQGAL